MIMKAKKFVMLLAALLPIMASAYDAAIKNADGKIIYYNNINSNMVEVTYRDTSFSDYSYTGSIVIPSKTRPTSWGSLVKSIGKQAFYGCETLTSVTIPNSVTSIGDNAFKDCSSLTSITIPNSVTSIGDNAFEDCSSLTSITIPNSVTSIGDNAFNYCSSLTTVTLNSNAIVSKNNIRKIFGVHVPEYVIIGDDVTSIGEGAFYNCYGLTSITIPSSVTSIGYGAFAWCDGLKKVIVSDIAAWCGIKFGSEFVDELLVDDLVGANPLLYAHHLYSDENTEIKDLVIPNSVTSIGNGAFMECYGLKSVTIGNSVTSIGAYAFDGCSGLTSVTIPNSVTSIGKWAFSGCSGLNSVTIPNSVTSIGAYAFVGCSGLKSVTIPSSVTSIGEWAFSGCSGLNSVTIPNSVTSIGEGGFRDCSGLKSVIIGNGVTSIGANAFRDCSGLKFVTIGNNAKFIGENAFDGADITTVISLIEDPLYMNYGETSKYRVFSQKTFNNAILYVPKGTIDKYKAASGWKDFVNIKEGLPTDVVLSDISDMTKVNDFDFTQNDYYITLDQNDKRGTAWETGNAKQQILYNVVIPAEMSNVLALQMAYSGNSGSKGWWARASNGGLYCYAAPRSGAVLNLNKGDIVVFETSAGVDNAITLTNGNGEPDGPFTFVKTSDGMAYYCTMTADGQLGFCGVKNKGYITSIKVYSNKPTGIQNVVKEVLSPDGEIYDLFGRKMTSLKKGINIVGGKKVVKK